MNGHKKSSKDHGTVVGRDAPSGNLREFNILEMLKTPFGDSNISQNNDSDMVYVPKYKVPKISPRGRFSGKNLNTTESAFYRLEMLKSSTIKKRRNLRKQLSQEINSTRGGRTSSRTSSSGTNEHTSAMSKAEFSRRISVMRNWYENFPIVKSYRSREPRPNKSNVPASQMKKPIIFETPEGLDIRFVLGLLTDVLSCALCDGLFYNAHTVKECMHTFCKSCIVLSTIERGLFCPTCKMPLPADIIEGIEYDHNIQGLVDKLFPKFNEIENEQKDLLDTFMRIGKKGVKLEIRKTRSLIRVTQPRSRVMRCLSSGAEEEKVDNRLTDSTASFLTDFIKNKNQEFSKLNGNVSCLALLHESDVADLDELFRNIQAFTGETFEKIGEKINKDSDVKFPRRFICVPKTTFIADITNYLVKSLDLHPEAKVVIMLNSIALPKNHSIEFICKSRRIDMTKCVLLRYKAVGR